MLRREQNEPRLTVGRVLRQVPYLAGIVVIYLIIALIDATAAASVIFQTTMPSGGIWVFTVGDLILFAGLLALFGEILKATRTSRVSVADHAMSLVAFIICLLAFLLLPAAATSIFFLLMIMTLVDVIAGFTVSLFGARRDIGTSGEL